MSDPALQNSSGDVPANSADHVTVGPDTATVIGSIDVIRPDGPATGTLVDPLEPVPGFTPSADLFDDAGRTGLDWATLPQLGEEEEASSGWAEHDQDDWTRLPFVAKPPWTWLCQLVVTRGDGSKVVCTGWFASAHLILTAGAAVFDPHRGWARQVQVLVPSLGQFGIESSATVLQAIDWKSVDGWVRHGDSACDYGYVRLDKAASAAMAARGYFGLAQVTSQGIGGLLANSCTFLSDRPAGTLWFRGLRVATARRKNFLFIGNDVLLPPGTPIWIRDGEGNRERRLVCGFAGSNRHPGYAILMNREVGAAIERWIRESEQTGDASQSNAQ